MTVQDKSDSIGHTPGLLGRAWAGSRTFRPAMFLLVALFLVFSLTQQYFFSVSNLRSMLLALAALFIVSIGMTFAVLSGGVDLSVGAAVALSGVFLAQVMEGGVNEWIAVALTLLFGAAVGGVVNGLLIAGGFSFFVVTLASLTALTGVVNLWTNTNSITVSSPLLTAIASNSLLGIPIIIWIMIAMFVGALYVQQRTQFGRNVFAVGGSMAAARMSGIRTGRTVVGVYALIGVCGAIAAIVTDAQLQVASPNVSASLALTAIAAVLLGGTNLMGGSGGVIGTVLGVLFIGVLQNGLNIAGIPSFWQNIATGVILVVAVTNSTAMKQRVKDAARRFRTPSALPTQSGTVIEAHPAAATNESLIATHKTPVK